MQKSEFSLGEICRTIWGKKKSRNTITYGHQREGPSALWKPAPICMGGQASKQEGQCLSVKGTFIEFSWKAVSLLLLSLLWQQGERQGVTFCMGDILASRDDCWHPKVENSWDKFWPACSKSGWLCICVIRSDLRGFLQPDRCSPATC